MSRTYAGFLFRCKNCGKLHLLDNEKPFDGIHVSCVNEFYGNEYKKEDFQFWHGSFWDVFDIRVQSYKK